MEKWTNDEIADSAKRQQASDKMKNIFQLTKFAKTPSSAQIIFEEQSRGRNINANRPFVEESEDEDQDPRKLRQQQKKLL